MHSFSTATCYDDASRRTSLTLPNGVLVEYGYDRASRVTGINYKLGATVLGNLTYTYDAAGNRTQIGGTFARAGLPPALSSAVYDAANRLTQWGATTLTYDNNGNLTNDGTNTYTWNARNQLSTIAGGATASFVYDGLGRRQRKTVGGARTEFLYDRFNPVQETDGPTVLANILGGLRVDEVFVRTDSAGPRNFLTDALGSTLALTDGAGAVQTEYTYEPFGRTTATGLASTNSYQFTGRENDATGLYYYRNRYYHPQFQRFISEDPIEFAGGDINLYAYVWDNPLMYVDPLGWTHGLRNDPSGCGVNCLDVSVDSPSPDCPIPGACYTPPPPKPPKTKTSDPLPKEGEDPCNDPRCKESPDKPCHATNPGGICNHGKPLPAKHPVGNNSPINWDNFRDLLGDLIEDLVRRMFGQPAE